MSAARTLVDLCLEVTGSKLYREVDASISLFDLGLTEAQVPLLCQRIKKETGVSISAEDILATQEIGAIAALLKKSAAPATNSASRSTKALKWLSVALLLPSVASAKVELDAQGCVTNFDPTADYFSPEHRAMMTSTGSVPSTVTFATDFSIEYFRTFKIVRNLLNSKVYVLHQCGAGAGPPAADLPADAKTAPVFTVPVQGWSTGGTFPIAFLEDLGVMNKAAVINPGYVSSSCALKLAGCGEITTMTDNSGDATGAWATNISASTSGVHFTDDWATGASSSLRDVAFDTATDPGALARAEWIKFVAAFFNLEPHANRVFNNIKAEFDQTKALAAAAVAGGVVAPKVLYIQAASAWGPAEISTVSYKLDYVASAGGVTPAAAVLAAHCTAKTATSAMSAADIVLGRTNGYTCTDAGLKAALAGIDVVIDETGGLAAYALSNFMTNFNFSSAMSATDYPFMNKVLRTDRIMAPGTVSSWGSVFQGSAEKEDGFVKVDAMLKDLASYIHPTLMPSTYAPHFVRNIAAAQTVTLASPTTCDDPYATCPGETAPPKPPTELNYCSGALCLLAAPPSPPPPPPTQPPPPPPSPSPEMPGTSLVAMEAEVFEISVTAAGTVETFDKAGYETNMRTYLGCEAPLCQVAIAVTAGSVNVVATVTDSTSTAVTAAKKLTTDSTAALSTALGVTVEAAPTVSAASETTLTVAVAPPPPIDNSKIDAAVVGGVVGGILGAVTLGLLVFVCYMYSREKQGNPVFQQMDEAKVVGAPATSTASESKTDTSSSSV